MSRKMSYLHHLLTRNENELILKMYKAQERCPIKDDWVLTANEDRTKLNLNMTNDEISIVKKIQFKKIIRKKVKDLAFAYLQNIKNSHSKVKHIVYNSLNMQDYLTQFEMEDAQLRSRMIDVRANYRSYYQDIYCKNYHKDIEETQDYLLECEALLKNCKDLYNDCSTEYEDIFEDSEKQLRATRLFQAVLEAREALLEESIL